MKKLIIPPVFVFLSIILIVAFYFVVPDYNYIPFPFNFGGLVIAFPGFAIMGKTNDLFNKHQTTRDFDKSSSLITEGVFARTRNPMYLGMFLLLLGIAICFGNLFSMLTPLGFVTAMHIIFLPKEEKLMLESFGEEYLQYKSKVRRWI